MITEDDSTNKEILEEVQAKTGSGMSQTTIANIRATHGKTRTGGRRPKKARTKRATRAKRCMPGSKTPAYTPPKKSDVRSAVQEVLRRMGAEGIERLTICADGAVHVTKTEPMRI